MVSNDQPQHPNCENDTVVRGQDRQKKNSKNKNQNFEEIIVSKKSFFAW
jgi:hypothetical protein